jgi:hypothetical protein
MRALRWSKHLAEIAAASAALVYACAAAAADKPHANDVTAGFNVAPQSLYWYGEVDHAFNGDIDKTGFLLRISSSLAAYNYEATLARLGEIDGLLYQVDVMPGYQIVRGGSTFGAYLGFDFQDSQLSPNDPTNAVNGSKGGIKIALSYEYDEKKDPITGSVDGEYSSVFDTYYVEAKLGLRLGDKLVAGPEAEADGDTGYNGQTLGGYATYTFDVAEDVSFDATLSAGHQFVGGGGSGPGGGAGTYGTLEITTDF